MPKKLKRLTRADKVALSKVTDDFQTADQIGVSDQSLDSLAAHGHVRAVLEIGSMRYRITEDGRAFLSKLPAEASS